MIWRLVLTAFLAFLILPVLLVVLFAFERNALIGFPLGGLTLDWFGVVWRSSEAWAAFRISLIVAISTALLSVVTGTLAAHGLLRLSPPTARAVMAALTAPVLLPPLVVAIAIVAFFVRGVGIGLGMPVVILAHVMIAQPFTTLVVMSRLARLDPAAADAARDLGASRLQAFRLVTLPQIAPALVGAGLIAASISLDDFIIASFTLGSGNTLSTFVWGKLRTTLDPSVNAMATVLLVLTAGFAAVALWLSRYRG